MNNTSLKPASAPDGVGVGQSFGGSHHKGGTRVTPCEASRTDPPFFGLVKGTGHAVSVWLAVG